jgi:hypothetical protein
MNSGSAIGLTCWRQRPNPLLKVPPARRGNRTPVWFPSRSGGNLKEWGKDRTQRRAIGIIPFA